MTRPQARRIFLRSGVAFCGLLLILWPASAFFACEFRLVNTPWYITADAGRGVLRLQKNHASGDYPISWSPHFRPYRYSDSTFPNWHWLPRITSSEDIEAYVSGEPPGTIIIPFWLLLLISAGATTLLHRRERAARLANLCPHCSYPLSGLPPQSPCPECGKKAPA